MAFLDHCQQKISKNKVFLPATISQTRITARQISVNQRSLPAKDQPIKDHCPSKISQSRITARQRSANQGSLPAKYQSIIDHCPPKISQSRIRVDKDLPIKDHSQPKVS
jgi:hypothetical protein